MATAEQRVLSALRGPVIPRMTFGVGYLVIRASDYEEVAQAIEAGKIQVKEDPGLGSKAHYYWNKKPGVLEISPTTSEALMIHESTHAIFDMRKLTSYVEQSEGFAYLAQALHKWLTNGGPPSSRYIKPLQGDFFSWGGWQLIWDESTRLAGKLANVKWIDESEVADLYLGIRVADTYRSRVGKVRVYDGI